LLFQKFFLSLF